MKAGQIHTFTEDGRKLILERKCGEDLWVGLEIQVHDDGSWTYVMDEKNLPVQVLVDEF